MIRVAARIIIFSSSFYCLVSCSKNDASSDASKEEKAPDTKYSKMPISTAAKLIEAGVLNISPRGDSGVIVHIEEGQELLFGGAADGHYVCTVPTKDGKCIFLLLPSLAHENELKAKKLTLERNGRALKDRDPLAVNPAQGFTYFQAKGVEMSPRGEVMAIFTPVNNERAAQLTKKKLRVTE